MKLMNIENVDKLFEVIDSCKGRVELVGEDIQLNLKSKLSQYFSMAKIFSDGDVVKELELVAYEHEDIDKLINFMMGK